MKRFIVSLALLLAALTFLGGSAHAAGAPLMKGLMGPADLAGRIESSLLRDPTGNSYTDPRACREDGSCATPYDYYYGIMIAHPNVRLAGVADLPRYIRSLVEKSAPSGEWQMSRLLNGRYDKDGWHRQFLQDERAWYDTQTGEPILAGDCGNVVGQRVGAAVASVPAVPRRFALPPFPVVPGPVAKGCSAGFGVRVSVYPLRRLYRERPQLYADAMSAVQAAKTRQQEGLGYAGPDFSRTYGAQLRRTWGVYADVDMLVEVRYLDPQTGQIVRQLAPIHVKHGIGDLRLPGDPRAYTVEFVFPSGPDQIATEPTPVIHDLPGEWPDCLQNISVGIYEQVLSLNSTSDSVERMLDGSLLGCISQY